MISQFFPYVNTYAGFSFIVMHKTVKFTDKSLIYLCICYNIILNNIYNIKRFLLNKVIRISEWSRVFRSKKSSLCAVPVMRCTFNSYNSNKKFRRKCTVLYGIFLLMPNNKWVDFCSPLRQTMPGRTVYFIPFRACQRHIRGFADVGQVVGIHRSRNQLHIGRMA